jgi:hypothetical protein
MPSVPPPAPKQRHTTRNLLIALGVLAVLLLVVSTTLVLVVRSPEDELGTGAPPTTASPTTTAPSSTGPSSSTPAPGPPTTVDPTPAGPPPSEEELRAEVAELSEFVERERGLAFLEDVDVRMADEATFDELVFEDWDDPESVEARASSGRILKSLGLVPPDLDMDETYRTLYRANVLGFYDPETDELVIRGQAITPYIRTTIVHELTHALDDQHFDLDRPEYDDLDDETAFGFSTVVEGNARVVEAAYIKAMTPAEAAQRDEEERQFGEATAPLMAGIPPALLEILQAPYEYGQPFVEAVLDLGGQEALDATIDIPPTTSTQVLHLDAFINGIGALDVEPPEADGEVLDDGIFGELLTHITLADSEDFTDASNAASGWAGDWFVTWEESPGSPCIRIAYEMATDGDLEELEETYTSWAAPRGATVERVGDRLEVTSCAAAAGGSSPL